MNYLRANKSDETGQAEASALLWQAAVLLGLLASGAIQTLKF